MKTSIASRIARGSLFLAGIWLASPVSATGPAGPATQPGAQTAAYDLRSLSDEALASSFRALENHGGEMPRDFVLNEMIRRSGDKWQKLLEESLTNPSVTVGDEHDPRRKSGVDIEILTALRRLQKKPDPVAVRIDSPVSQQVVFPGLPVLDVALINQDAQGRSVGYQVGGDYRSGRRTRWLIEAVDQHEKRIQPLPEQYGFGVGGGICSSDVLGPADSWTTTLNVASYLPALSPGKYKLRVLYHNQITIADRESVDGLIMSSLWKVRGNCPARGMSWALVAAQANPPAARSTRPSRKPSPNVGGNGRITFT